MQGECIKRYLVSIHAHLYGQMISFKRWSGGRCSCSFLGFSMMKAGLICQSSLRQKAWCMHLVIASTIHSVFLLVRPWVNKGIAAAIDLLNWHRRAICRTTRVGFNVELMQLWCKTHNNSEGSFVGRQRNCCCDWTAQLTQEGGLQNRIEFCGGLFWKL